MTNGIVDSVGGVSDVIVGHNNKGPYYLTWTNVSPDSIVVTVNGRMLKRGDDYNIDLKSGMIAFNSIVENDAIVHVSYQTVPGKSQRTAGGPSVPVNLSLFQGQSASLNLTALYAHNDPNNPDAGKTIIGLGGNKSWAGTKFNSQFLISQKDDTNPQADNANTWERAAMKLGGDTSVGALKLTGSFQHAGDAFSGAKEFGTGLGKDVTNLGAAFAPTKTIQASASFVSNKDTAGATNGNSSTVNQQSIVFTPGKSTNLSLCHTTNDTANAAGSETSVDTKSVQFSQKFGAATSALASFNDTTTLAGTAHDHIRVSGFQISSTALRKTSLQTTLTQKYSDSQGSEQSIGFGMSTKPVNQVSVDFGYGMLDNQSVGHQASTNVKVTASPVKQVAVQAAYSGVDSTVLGQTSTANVAVQASPVRGMQFQGSFAENVQNSQQQFQRNFSLTGAPVQFAKFTAMFSQKGVNSLDDVTKGAQLQLSPAKSMTLAAGYKYVETGPQVMTIWDYSAATKPCNFFSLAGDYRQRDLQDSDAPDTTNMSLALSPARLFTLTGEYHVNPEDKNGVVQNYNSTVLGMTTHIGSIGLQTNYSQKDEYLASRFSDERGLGFALPFFGHGQLTTGCKLARYLDGSDSTTRTYSLGYTHSIGSDFSLTLTGYYTQYLQNNTLQPDKTEYSAEANLGVKF